MAGRVEVGKEMALEEASLSGKGSEVVGVDAEDVLGEASKFHTGEEDGDDGVYGGLALDLKLLQARYFFFP